MSRVHETEPPLRSVLAEILLQLAVVARAADISRGSARRRRIARAQRRVANGRVGRLGVEVAEATHVCGHDHGRGMESRHAPGFVAP
jgi:hypothetical protein